MADEPVASAQIRFEAAGVHDILESAMSDDEQLQRDIIAELELAAATAWAASGTTEVDNQIAVG
jgi:hypothetical protein